MSFYRKYKFCAAISVFDGVVRIKGNSFEEGKVEAAVVVEEQEEPICVFKSLYLTYNNYTRWWSAEWVSFFHSRLLFMVYGGQRQR